MLSAFLFANILHGSLTCVNINLLEATYFLRGYSLQSSNWDSSRTVVSPREAYPGLVIQWKKNGKKMKLSPKKQICERLKTKTKIESQKIRGLMLEAQFTL